MTTKRSDLVIPEVLQEAIQAEFAGMTIFGDSGVASVSGSLPNTIGGTRVRGGDTVKVPYFDAIGELEDITTEGDALTPDTLTMQDEEASVVHSGKAIELTTWARLAAEYADPYAEVARQFRVMVQRKAEGMLLAKAFAALPSDYVLDKYTGTPELLTYDNMIAAKLLWGDEQDDIAMLGVHSKVYGDLLTLKDDNLRPLLLTANEGGITRFSGVQVRTSDRHSKSADTPPKYTSILAKRGALALWYQGVPRVLTDQDVLADTDVVAIHVYWVAHRYLRVRGGSKPGIVKILTK